MSKPQSYANHARIDPAFHYFVAPVLLLNIVYRIILLVRHTTPDALWSVILAVALLLLAMTARMYALKVQDRVIRMEERVRIAAVGSPSTLARMDEFSVGQLIALRFAPFAELGALADRALAENLSPKQIKQSIVQWRADTHRV